MKEVIFKDEPIVIGFLIKRVTEKGLKWAPTLSGDPLGIIEAGIKIYCPPALEEEVYEWYAWAEQECEKHKALLKESNLDLATLTRLLMQEEIKKRNN